MGITTSVTLVMEVIQHDSLIMFWSPYLVVIKDEQLLPIEEIVPKIGKTHLAI